MRLLHTAPIVLQLLPNLPRPLFAIAVNSTALAVNSTAARKRAARWAVVVHLQTLDLPFPAVG